MESSEMNSRNRFVILTGSKNNAGDFLIKYRALRLFAEIRPDVEIVDFDAWGVLDAEKISIVNSSLALILMGGPALRSDMYPEVYRLCEDLNDIHVPIITMGIGWKSPSGNWRDTILYRFDDKTAELLERIEESGFYSSVRDSLTLNVLETKGYHAFQMTGCPAYYDLENIGKSVSYPEKIRHVAFSLGVAFIGSQSMRKAIEQQILHYKSKFEGSRFTVVFHHTLDTEIYRVAYGSRSTHHVELHQEMADWLSAKGIAYTDISGSAENLMNFYSTVDLHIGYRVHAHIFMMSVSKLSILLAEDGRGKAVGKTIGEAVVSAFTRYRTPGLILRILRRLFSISVDHYMPNRKLIVQADAYLEAESQSGGDGMRRIRKVIDRNFSVMTAFLKQLPKD